ncbi:hypothetical protein [Terrimonas alba]|uniref:hypothetical protein n=1 Tax=Terrimonas alba TaxID=3349636 RepID=UPI0035F41884
MKKILFILIIIITKNVMYAQGVKIGAVGNPDQHAILELDGSAGKGLLLPRITDVQMNAMAAPDGMIVYNSTDGSIYLRKSAAWVVVAANNNNGGFSLPLTASHNVDGGYVLNLTNTSVNGVNGAIKGYSSTSGYGVHGSSFTGIGGYFKSDLGPALVTGTGDVGIGTAMPVAKIHAVNNNSNLFQLENTTALNPGINTRAYFKTGAFYTGGIGSTGIGSLNARMSFFSGVTASGDALIEKMSILANGNVGINTTAPASKLDVNGKGTFSQGAGENAAIEIKGNIRVSGVNAPAFTVTLTGPDTKKIVIDHPSCNGDPNALLFITQTSGLLMPYEAKWDAGLQKWTIITGGHIIALRFDYNLKNCSDECISVPVGVPTESLFYTGHQFNVLVIKQ